MYEELDQQAAWLRDASKGWVYRRDAADYLGKAVGKAVGALRAVAQDGDVDVRTAAERALGGASAVLAGIAPARDDRAHTLDELAEGCASPGRREVTKKGDAFLVTVQLREGRSQRVFLRQIARKDGASLVQVVTYCGTFNESTMSWALKINTQLSRCAVGIEEIDGEAQYVLVHCVPAAEARPDDVKRIVKEIAFYGDWIEKKLTGEDNF